MAADLGFMALDTLDDGIIIVGANGRIVRANPALQKFFSCLPEEMAGSEISGVITRHLVPMLGDTQAGQIRSALSHDADGVTFTTRVNEPSRRWISISVRCLDDTLNAHIIRFSDVSGAEHTRQFRTALDHSPVVVFAQDRDLRYFWTYNQQHGHTNESVIGSTDDSLFLQEDAARLTALKRLVIETGEIVRAEVPLTLCGVKRIRDLTLEPIRGMDGVITGISGAAFDVTERRRAEEALQESEERFRSIFQEAGIGIVLSDMNWRIVKSNPAFRRMIGYNEDELKGMSITDYTHPDDVEESRVLLAGMIAGHREHFEVEKRYVRKNGSTFPGRLTATILRDAKGTPRHTLGMVEDITERKIHEEIRRQAYNRIEQNMEQFAILGDHVRHPLQVILARADLMVDREAAVILCEQVRRINSLIEQLDQGWIESRKIREFLRRNELV